jgi:hypothetical protein
MNYRCCSIPEPDTGIRQAYKKIIYTVSYRPTRSIRENLEISIVKTAGRYSGSFFYQKRASVERGISFHSTLTSPYRDEYSAFIRSLHLAEKYIRDCRGTIKLIELLNNDYNEKKQLHLFPEKAV